jgi:hypothetical protein
MRTRFFGRIISSGVVGQRVVHGVFLRRFAVGATTCKSV